MIRPGGTAGWIGVALVCAAALSPGITVAADSAAENLVREGIALRRKGDDAAALEKFQEAFRLDSSARTMAQIALAEQALGRWVPAHEHLTHSLESKSDPWIKKNRAPLSDALKVISEHVGQLEILGGTPGTEVRINSVSRGQLPLARPLTLATGTVTIDLAAPGFVPLQRSTVIRAHEVLRESFDPLTPVAGGERTPAAASGRAKAGATTAPRPELAAATSPDTEPPLPRIASAPIEKDKDAPDRGDSQPSRFRSKAKWVAFGVGALALGAGIYGWARQNQAGDTFASGCGVDDKDNVVVPMGSSRTVDECRGFRNQIDSNFRIEVAGLIGAGVLAATGLVLWLTEPDAAGERQSAALACAPGPMTGGEGASLSCALRF